MGRALTREERDSESALWLVRGNIYGLLKLAPAPCPVCGKPYDRRNSRQKICPQCRKKPRSHANGRPMKQQDVRDVLQVTSLTHAEASRFVSLADAIRQWSVLTHGTLSEASRARGWRAHRIAQATRASSSHARRQLRDLEAMAQEIGLEVDL